MGCCLPVMGSARSCHARPWAAILPELQPNEFVDEPQAICTGPAAVDAGSPSSGAAQEVAADSSSTGSVDEDMLSPEELWTFQVRRLAKAHRRRQRRQQIEQPVQNAKVCGWSNSHASDEGINGDFDMHYSLGRRIDNGSFAVIYSCTHHGTKKEYAVKAIDRKKYGRAPLLVQIDKEICVRRLMDRGMVRGALPACQLDRELVISKSICHPNIVKCIESLQTAKHAHIVMELYTGGSLFECIVAQSGVAEADAAHLAKQMAAAVVYLHASLIVHRDVKPENFMLADRSPLSRATIKLIDFGFARHFVLGEHMQTVVCTPAYVAPEVLAGRYSQTCDIWSLGIVFYVLLSGVPPFHAGTDLEVLEKVKGGQFEFGVPHFASVGNDARELIRSMIHLDAQTRVRADDVVKHAWLKSPVRSWRPRIRLALESVRGRRR